MHSNKLIARLTGVKRKLHVISLQCARENGTGFYVSSARGYDSVQLVIVDNDGGV